MKQGIFIKTASSVAAAACLWCGAAMAADQIRLTGSGAIFPAPIYTTWFKQSR